MTDPGEQQFAPEILANPMSLGGVWANFATVSHSPYEFTLDFIRVDYSNTPPKDGVLVGRVNMSPLFVSQLIDALQQNWASYAQKALPVEVTHVDEADDDPSRG